MFITFLYMFRGTMSPSSGENTVKYVTSGITKMSTRNISWGS